MMTWAERTETWKLRRKIQAVHRTHRLDPSPTRAELSEKVAKYIRARKPLEQRLWVIETSELLRMAGRLSIAIDPEFEDEGLANGQLYLSRKDRAALRRTIRNERREVWKFWIGVLMPPLSLLVALASVFNSCSGE